MVSTRINAALARADEAVRPRALQPLQRAYARRVAMGDPQAPFEKVLAILDHADLLGADGWLRPDVLLVSMGDHFDWGKRADRERARTDGLRLFRWLSRQLGRNVVMLLGNHDLARVGEMVSFDDGTFAAAQREADALYGDGQQAADLDAERAFLERYPALPSVEIAARDFATYNEAQRELVRTSLVMLRKMALSHASPLALAYAPAPDLLLTHAGVSRDDLDALGLSAAEQRNAEVIAHRINRSLLKALDESDEPLVVPHLHRPGDAVFGEGRGVLYHRPANPSSEDHVLFERPWARRFDPRQLPLGLTQAIGHIRDRKCRALLGAWASPEPATDGPIRHLRTDGHTVRYALGTPEETAPQTATMLFLDGGMLHTTVEEYELLDLDTRRPLR